MKKIFVLFLLYPLVKLSFSQKINTNINHKTITACGNDKISKEEYIAQSNNYKLLLKLIEKNKKNAQISECNTCIPVIFHHLMSAEESGNIFAIGNRLKVAESGIKQLNDYYNSNNPNSTNVNIHFCLANVDTNGNLIGINGNLFHQIQEIWYSDDLQEDIGINGFFVQEGNFLYDSIIDSLNYSTDKYINLYVANDLYINALTYYPICGISVFPKIDDIAVQEDYGIYDISSLRKNAIFMDPRCLGSINYADEYTGLEEYLIYPDKNRGSTFAHEMGHYLGLHHIWGTDGDCDEPEDYIDDTPPALINHDETDCSLSGLINTCSNDMPDLPDDIENIMSYTNDECRHRFSAGQTQRIHDILDLENVNIYDLQFSKLGLRRAFIKVYLGGVITDNNLMDTTLSINNLLPINNPYANSPWCINNNCVLLNTASNIVDWLVVKLRSAQEPYDIVEEQIAFLRNDGTLVDEDGIPGVPFFGNDDENYKIEVEHRNHIDILSSGLINIGTVEYSNYGIPVYFQTNMNAATYDFTNGIDKALGGTQTYIAALDAYGMIPGDADGNGVVTFDDFNIYSENNESSNVYSAADFNLDGNVNVLDFDLYLQNSVVMGVPEIRNITCVPEQTNSQKYSYVSNRKKNKDIVVDIKVTKTEIYNYLGELIYQTEGKLIQNNITLMKGIYIKITYYSNNSIASNKILVVY